MPDTELIITAYTIRNLPHNIYEQRLLNCADSSSAGKKKDGDIWKHNFELGILFSIFNKSSSKARFGFIHMPIKEEI